MLLQFAEERGELFFSERLGIDFVEDRFHILEKDFNRTLSQSNTQELRVIRMIGDFQLHNSILRRYYKHKEILLIPTLSLLVSALKPIVRTKHTPRSQLTIILNNLPALWITWLLKGPEIVRK
jgi:hypothetical protein